MKPPAFKYRRASCAEEARHLLEEFGEDARCLAGGQSLVPMMNFRIARPSALVDLNGCDDLSYIEADENGLRIGAMSRQRDVEISAIVRNECPLICEALGHVGSPTIRNRGTVGGSIANGYPLAELISVAVCLDAIMIVESADGRRRIRPAEFFLAAMQTDIQPGAILREVVFPRRRPNSVYAFKRIGNHVGGSALALVTAYGEVYPDGRFAQIMIAASGLDAVPIRLRNVEQGILDGIPQQEFSDAYRADLQSREFREENEVMRYVEDVVATLTEDAIGDLRSGGGRTDA